MKAYVQFSSSKQLTIIAVFANPQDASAYKNQSEIDITDQRYVTFAANFPATLPEPH